MMSAASLLDSLIQNLSTKENNNHHHQHHKKHSHDNHHKKKHSNDEHHGHHKTEKDHSHEHKQHHHHHHDKNKNKNKNDVYDPKSFWSGNNDHFPPLKPYVFVSPMRFVLGNGVFDQIAHYLALIPSQNPGIVITKQGLNRFGERLKKMFKLNNPNNIQPQYLIFEGACLFKGADQIISSIDINHNRIDCVIGIGGGKIIDVAKLVAKNLNQPIISIPTIASNECSCSALSIIHCSKRGFRGLLCYKNSPLMVIVDSGIILSAPAKYFVAGIGDAMATYYETSICSKNPNATNCLGGRICLSTLAMAKICQSTLFDHAINACLSFTSFEMNDSFEKCIECATLLSGIGFESGGIALCHAIAHSMTVGAKKHKDYMHGENVAIGLLTQLSFQNDIDEFKKIARLYCKIGLPVSYKQLKLNIYDEHNHEIKAILDVLFGDRLEFRNNQIGDVNKTTVYNAMKNAEQLVEPILKEIGQEAFIKFHS